ncbi:thymidine kinase [Patescibacteria group bacterium]
MPERKTEKRFSTATLEVITGCMFSGKSDELARRLRIERIAKKKTQLFKPNHDSNNRINSHSGSEYVAELVDILQPESILEKVNKDTDIVAVDDVHFFGVEIKDVCKELVNRGKRVIVAGLDMDSQKEVYNSTALLMAEADEVKKLSAVCMVCGEDANYTKKLAKGSATDKKDYEARCRTCHKVL